MSIKKIVLLFLGIFLILSKLNAQKQQPSPKIVPGKVTCVKKGMVKIRFGHGYILWAVNTGGNCKGDRVFVIVKK